MKWSCLFYSKYVMLCQPCEGQNFQYMKIFNIWKFSVTRGGPRISSIPSTFFNIHVLQKRHIHMRKRGEKIENVLDHNLFLSFCCLFAWGWNSSSEGGQNNNRDGGFFSDTIEHIVTTSDHLCIEKNKQKNIQFKFHNQTCLLGQFCTL